VTIATLAGAVFAGIAGFLKATVGAHEVISTIMLNWVAFWVGNYLFGLGGALQNSTQKFVPISNDVVEKAKLPVFWGDPLLQGLHVGFFIALGALVVYCIAVALLGRHTAFGVFFAALLFGALLTGTSTRHLSADIFRPDLAGNLTQIIQGLIVLFVGADLLILAVWNQRKRLRLRRGPA